MVSGLDQTIFCEAKRNMKTCEAPIFCEAQRSLKTCEAPFERTLVAYSESADYLCVLRFPADWGGSGRIKYKSLYICNI